MAEAYLHAKFHLDPSNRLVTIHQRYRQDRQDRRGQTDRQTDRQRTDTVGRTVLQTVAQKLVFAHNRRKLSSNFSGISGTVTHGTQVCQSISLFVQVCYDTIRYDTIHYIYVRQKADE